MQGLDQILNADKNGEYNFGEIILNQQTSYFDGQNKIAEISHSIDVLKIALFADRQVNIFIDISVKVCIIHSQAPICIIGKLTVAQQTFLDTKSLLIGNQTSQTTIKLLGENYLHMSNCELIGDSQLSVISAYDNVDSEIVVENVVFLDQMSVFNFKNLVLKAGNIHNDGLIALENVTGAAYEISQNGFIDALRSKLTIQQSFRQNQNAESVFKQTIFQAQRVDILDGLSEFEKCECSINNIGLIAGKFRIKNRSVFKVIESISTNEESLFQIQNSSVNVEQFIRLNGTVELENALIQTKMLTGFGKSIDVKSSHIEAEQRLTLMKDIFGYELSVASNIAFISGSIKLEKLEIKAQQVEFDLPHAMIGLCHCAAIFLKLHGSRNKDEVIFIQSQFIAAFIQQSRHVTLTSSSLIGTQNEASHAIEGQLKLEGSRFITDAQIHGTHASKVKLTKASEFHAWRYWSDKASKFKSKHSQFVADNLLQSGTVSLKKKSGFIVRDLGIAKQGSDFVVDDSSLLLKKLISAGSATLSESQFLAETLDIYYRFLAKANSQLQVSKKTRLIAQADFRLIESALKGSEIESYAKIYVNDGKIYADERLFLGLTSQTILEGSSLIQAKNFNDFGLITVKSKMLPDSQKKVFPQVIVDKDFTLGATASIVGDDLNLAAEVVNNKGEINLDGNLQARGTSFTNAGKINAQGNLDLGYDYYVLNSGEILGGDITIHSNFINWFGTLTANQQLSIAGLLSLNFGIIYSNNTYVDVLAAFDGIHLPNLNGGFSKIFILSNFSFILRNVLTILAPEFQSSISALFMLYNAAMPLNNAYKLCKQYNSWGKIQSMRWHEIIPIILQLKSTATTAYHFRRSVDGAYKEISKAPDHFDRLSRAFRQSDNLPAVVLNELSRRVDLLQVASDVMGFAGGRYYENSLVHLGSLFNLSFNSIYINFYHITPGLEISLLTHSIDTRDLYNFLCSLGLNASYRANNIHNTGIFGALFSLLVDGDEMYNAQTSLFLGYKNNIHLRKLVSHGLMRLSNGRLDIDDVYLSHAATENFSNLVGKFKKFRDDSQLFYSGKVFLVTDKYKHRGKFIHDKESELTDDHLLFIKAKKAKLSGGSDAHTVYFEFDHFADGSKLVEGSGHYANYHFKSLGFKTKDRLVLIQSSRQDCDFDLTAHTIINKSFLRGKDRILLRATKGNIENHGAYIGAKKYVQLIAAKDIKNLCRVATKRGKYSMRKYFDGALIAGGDGSETDGRGLYAYAGGKIIGDASDIMSNGLNVLVAHKGFNFTAQHHTYISKYFTETSGFWGINTKTIMEMRTVVRACRIHSQTGQSILVSQEGGIYSVATAFTSTYGTLLYLNDKPQIYGLKTKECRQEINTGLWGFRGSSKHETHEVYMPTLFVDKGITGIFAPGHEFDLRGAYFIGPGGVAFDAGDRRIYFGHPTLNHAIEENRWSTDVSMFGTGTYHALRRGGNILDACTAEDATLAKLRQLNGGATALEFFANATNLGIDLANTTNSVLRGIANQNLGAELIARYSIGQATLSFQHSQSRYTYQTLGAGGVDRGGSLRIKAGGVVLENGVRIHADGPHDIDTPYVLLYSAQLTSTYRRQDMSLSASFSMFTGNVTNIGVNFSETRAESVTHHYAELSSNSSIHFHDGDTPMSKLVLDGGKVISKTTSGDIEHAYIRDKQDSSFFETTSFGGRLSGQVNLYHGQGSSRVTRDHPGIFVQESNDNDLHIRNAEITGGGRIVGPITVNQMRGRELHDHNNYSGFGVGFNVHEAARFFERQQPSNAPGERAIPTMQFSLDHIAYKAVHSPIIRQNGNSSVSFSDGLRVLEQSEQHLALDIPIGFSSELAKNFRAGLRTSYTPPSSAAEPIDTQHNVVAQRSASQNSASLLRHTEYPHKQTLGFQSEFFSTLTSHYQEHRNRLYENLNSYFADHQSDNTISLSSTRFGFFPQHKPRELGEPLYRGDLRHYSGLFEDGFYSRGNNTDLRKHVFPIEEDFLTDSAYVSLSKSKSVAVTFPRELSLTTKKSYVYEINTTRHGIDVPERIMADVQAGKINPDDYVTAKYEREHVFNEIKPHEIEGAWIVEIERTDVSPSEAWTRDDLHTRTLTNKFVPNPNFRRPFGQTLWGLGRTAGFGLSTYGALVDGFSLFDEIKQSHRSGNYDNTYQEATRIAGGWAGAYAMGSFFGKTGVIACSPAGPVSSAACGFVGGVIGSGLGYAAGSETAIKIYDVNSESRARTMNRP